MGTVDHAGTTMTIVGFAAPNLTVYSAKPQTGLLAEPMEASLLGLGGLGLVALLAAVTWYGIGRVLAPVDAIRTELTEITATDLSRRVPQPVGRNEISLLAFTVNDTLDRLQEAVKQQRRFVADASHELRSPITALRTEVDLALLEGDETCPGSIKAIDRSTGRLQNLVEDLLAVARLDAGIPRDFERLDLDELVSSELARRQDPPVLIETHLQPGVMVDGVRVELSRLLVNLLDNAVRHADSKVSITTRSDCASGAAILEVRDDGLGLANEDRERVFHRFTRLAEGRAKDPGGSGLGLAIAREIAEGHFGSLRAEDSPRGARFVLRLRCAS